jgi:predicted transposase YbfD/YdcC
MEGLYVFLCSIEDERQEWKVEHKLADIVFIVLIAILANADDWQEIGIFAKENEGILRKYIPLENGIPSHDTIQRVMACIKPEVMQHVNILWNELLNSNEGEKIKKILCIDGKTMRGSRNKNSEALHVVSAWSKENGVCFGQKSEDSKGKEIPMIKDLMDTISVKNQVVTIDAIGTQTDIADKIIKGRGDYVLAVKGNQETLHEEISLYFADEEFIDRIKAEGQYHRTSEKAHGQIEIREYFQTDDIKWLTGAQKWNGIKSIGMTRTICKSEKGETYETRYYISSLSPDIKLFARAVRGHWAVESMHWPLDVTFREDHNQTLEKAAAENLNILRKLALSILKVFELDKKYSLKKKRFALSCGFHKFIHKLMAI